MLRGQIKGEDICEKELFNTIHHNSTAKEINKRVVATKLKTPIFSKVGSRLDYEVYRVPKSRMSRSTFVPACSQRTLWSDL